MTFVACSEATPYVSDGVRQGVEQSTTLFPGESYTGRLAAIELSVLDQPDSAVFAGRVRNETSAPLCDVRVSVLLDGARQLDAPAIAGMRVSDGAAFTVQSDGSTYSEWQVQVDSTGCTSVGAPLGYQGNAGGESGEGGRGAEGSEGGSEGHGNEGGGEGHGNEGGGEGRGNEGGGEGGVAGEGGTASFPFEMPFVGTTKSLDFHNFAWDAARGIWRGTYQNNTGAPICGSKIEVHTTLPSGNTLELGPTTPMDVAPGQDLTIVFEPGEPVTTYQIHPEDSICP